jgi:hypothetical protein
MFTCGNSRINPKSSKKEQILNLLNQNMSIFYNGSIVFPDTPIGYIKLTPLTENYTSYGVWKTDY